MTTFKDALVANCLSQLSRFGNGTKIETDDPHFRFVGEYWTSLVKNLKSNGCEWNKASLIVGFISFVVNTAGADSRFMPAEPTQSDVHMISLN